MEKLTLDERYYYLLGYANGGDWLAAKIFTEIGAGSVSKETTDKILQTAMDTFPSNMTYGEFIDAISRMYDDDPTNAPLAILSIADAVVMKGKGASRAQIDARLEAQRAYWNNPPK